MAAEAAGGRRRFLAAVLVLALAVLIAAPPLLPKYFLDVLISVLFTAYLTYVEGFVLHAWCRWCLGSAAIILAIFLTSVLGLKSFTTEATEITEMS